MISQWFGRQAGYIAIVALVALVAPFAASTSARASGSSATISPTAGPRGTQVTATGSGWTPGDEIQAIWGSTSGPDVGSPVEVNGDGDFTLTFDVPSGAILGSYQVFFWDENEQYFEVANQDFTVTPPIAVTGISTVGWYLENGPSGHTANLPGWHDTASFVPGEPVLFTVAVRNTGNSSETASFVFAITGPRSVTWRGSAQIPSGTSGWEIREVIPNSPPSGTYTYTVRVSVGSSGKSDHARFTIAGQERTLGTVRPAGSANPYANDVGRGECTYGADNIAKSFTKYLYSDLNGRYLPNYGNADAWASAAAGDKWKVSASPQLDSVVVFPPGVDGTDRSVGHVAWLTKVGRSTITVEEMNGTAGRGRYDYFTYARNPRIRYILLTDSANGAWTPAAAGEASQVTIFSFNGR